MCLPLHAQDSGLPDRATVLLGFPPCDGYIGGGVFSSSVKLSHPLRPPTSGGEHGGVLEFERWAGEDGGKGGWRVR